MSVQWIQDSDAALTQAKTSGKPALLDFSAAPAWGACVRLEAESYANEEIASFIHQNFLPVTINIKQAPAQFKRFDVLWTPTVLFLDSAGAERLRMEGYLPRNEFGAELEMALGRIAFMHKQWAEAEKWYKDVIEKYADTAIAPEAFYWTGVSHYKKTNDHTVLDRLAQQLAEKYPDSLWAEKTIPWRPAPQPKSA